VKGKGSPHTLCYLPRRSSEKKIGGGINLPDFALHDSDGEFLVVCGEVKLPAVELDQLAMFIVGRYLATTGVVLNPKWKGDGPKPEEWVLYFSR
jgi:hypothetical protein